jgi:hypothetical protein
LSQSSLDPLLTNMNTCLLHAYADSTKPDSSISTTNSTQTYTINQRPSRSTTKQIQRPLRSRGVPRCSNCMPWRRQILVARRWRRARIRLFSGSGGRRRGCLLLGVRCFEGELGSRRALRGERDGGRDGGREGRIVVGMS